MANTDHNQFYLEPPQPQSLDDFFEVKGGVVHLKGTLQTDNFISGQRGVRIERQGLSANGGSVSGATLGGTLTTVSSLSVSASMSHAGTLGFFGATPASKTAVSGLTDSTGGTADSTVQNVGAAFSQATLNNNFADITAKLNAVISALQSYGLM